MTRRAVTLVLLLTVAGVALYFGAAQLLGDDGSSDDTADQSRPAAPAKAKRTAIVWAVGDGADGGGEAREVANLIARGRPDRFLYLGDVYEHGTADEFEHRYKTVYGELDRITAPTPGNHDWPNHEEGYDPYWRERNPELPDNRHYYRFTLGGWEFLSLNSESGLERGSPQMRWLRERMRGRGTCRIAFLHRPYLNAGRHDDQQEIAPLWRTLRGHAALMVAGHDHNMQHFKRKDGIVQLIAGAGGHGQYSSNENDPRLVWDEDDEYGALRLDLRRGLARFRFVAADGRTLHRGSVNCKR